MSVTTASEAVSILARYHRDKNGLPVEFLQEFNPEKNYLHYVDELHAEVASPVMMCGATPEPDTPDTPGGELGGQLVCPHCYLETISRRPAA